MTQQDGDDPKGASGALRPRGGGLGHTEEEPVHSPTTSWGPGPATPASALWPLIAGARGTQLVYVAAKLGIADRLAGGSRHSAELAREIEVDARALHRVMRGLVTIGVLREEVDGSFSVTTLGDFLRTDRAESMRDWAIVWGELHYRSWSGLLHGVRTGEPAFPSVFGMGLWDYLAQNDDLRDHFHRVMSLQANSGAAPILSAYDFSGARTVVDVGAGRGALLAAILSAFPEARGILYDQPAVMPGARKLLETAGVANRCALVEGDFFEVVPKEGDVYVLMNILHDWDDASCRRILTCCRRAMRFDSKLLVIEMVLPERVEQMPFIVQMDLQMLVGPGGRKRTVGEFRELLASAGFDLSRVVATRSVLTVLEAGCAVVPEAR